MSIPTVARIEWMLTRRCNNNCAYCKIRNPGKRLGKELSTGEVLRVADIINTYWPGAPINLFGGEPTERTDLPALIRVLVELKQPVILSSNSIKAYSDPKYIEELALIGLRNWTVSFDGMTRQQCVDHGSWNRALIGMEVLQMARRYGITDLVANITVSKHNIEYLPGIVRTLTGNGIWSILCMLQVGHNGYEYSQGDPKDLPSEAQIQDIFPRLAKMVRSKKYLIQTSAEWFEFLMEHGVEQQTWKCNDKASLTIDADGSLKHCVDVPLPKRLTIFDLEQDAGLNLYNQLIKNPKCEGCLWDSAYDSINRSRNILGEKEAQRLYRHELTNEEIEALIPNARQYFKRR